MRLIARLDVKNEFVIKGISFDGLRKVGEPLALATAYYDAGIDELVFIDSVASLYDRNNLFHIIRQASDRIFVPITIGGGLRSLGDVGQALDSGADKVALNTFATRSPTLVSEVARRFGSQCVVGSIQAKRTADGWEAYVESGRERTGLAVVSWAKRLEELGAGELLVTSVDQDGTRRGFDVELIRAVNAAVSIPVIAGGGYGERRHFRDLLAQTRPSALCVASALHYKRESVGQLRASLVAEGAP